ncbi:hypothetical protein OPQ81_003366 [Rhizoctonia solani]|nr:hypothetical protein OPQ81_003366 [Rhizoctonia solani]
MSSKAIGIDLGTTYCCVGVWQNDRVETIPNDQGNRTTPSYVSFSDTGRLIGDAAKNHITMNPVNTVFNTKRLIGRRFDDAEVQSDIKRFPFKVEDKDGKPVIVVEYRGQTKTLTLEEISSMILLKMKETAEAHLGTPVTNAVITVPTYFNYLQRQAIKDASVIAGINVLRIISDPTAAAIAYTLDSRVQGERTVLIFDLGGGSVGVSLVTIEDDIVEVRATAASSQLGGEDFDNRLVNHYIQEFKRKHKKDISSNPRALCRLRTACERAKRTLSSATSSSIEIESLFEGIDFYTRLTRANFEELCGDLFRRSLEPIEKVLRNARIDKSNVDDIVLVGGSTRIPRVMKLVSDFFNGKAPNRSINPEEAVAHGAAIQAAILNGDPPERVHNLLLLDAVSWSTGIEAEGGMFAPIIRRNSSFPTKKSEIISTDFDNQTSKLIKVYEGEHAHAKDNNLLGEFELTGIPPAPRGVPQIEVTFDIGGLGILSVSATEKTSGNSNCVGVTFDNLGLSKEDIRRMVSEAEKYKKDEQAAASVAIEDTLESYVDNLRDILQDDKLTNQLDAMDKFKLEYVLNETTSWLDASKKEYERRQRELEALANPIISRLCH